MSAVHSSDRRTRVPTSVFPLVRGDMWSGTGSNCRPSAFQVNRAKRYADLRKRTSPTSETALGGRCNMHASRAMAKLCAFSWRRNRPELDQQSEGVDLPPVLD